ncbi:MAG: hypothetical protein ACJ73D_09005 [Pyrinomonadaceae bacterium]
MPHQRFESFGVHLNFVSDDTNLLKEATDYARSSLLGHFRLLDNGHDDLTFELRRSGRNYLLDRNGVEVSRGPTRKTFLKYFEAVVRLSVAEFSPDLVFLHAGCVSWRGRGLVLPANSFQGKSTLVSELVRAGAEYYSDDFAILDQKGRVHPFARKISMRTREAKYSQYELDPISFGGVIGHRPVPVGMVFLTTFRPRSHWKPRIFTRGEGILHTVPFTLPMNRAPERSLKALKRLAQNAIIATSDRGDARRTAKLLLNFFDLNVK